MALASVSGKIPAVVVIGFAAALAAATARPGASSGHASPAAEDREAVAQASTQKCVTIAAPRPDRSFVYHYTDSTGAKADFTNRWEQFSAIGSRLVTTRTGSGAGSWTYESLHAVINDVFALTSSTATGNDGRAPFKNSMMYKPAAIGDPAFRACEGQQWDIASVSATGVSGAGTFTSPTDPGTMRILAVGVSVTVPAGTFDTVHYTKTMRSPRGQMVDEFWKSTEHGVTVRRTFTQPGASGSEVLQMIK